MLRNNTRHSFFSRLNFSLIKSQILSFPALNEINCFFLKMLLFGFGFSKSPPLPAGHPPPARVLTHDSKAQDIRQGVSLASYHNDFPFLFLPFTPSPPLFMIIRYIFPVFFVESLLLCAGPVSWPVPRPGPYPVAFRAPLPPMVLVLGCPLCRKPRNCVGACLFRRRWFIRPILNHYEDSFPPLWRGSLSLFFFN